MNESEKQFSFTRAALSTGGRAGSKFLSLEFSNNSGIVVDAWIGGYQPSGSPEPAGNWTWVTGEPWTFSAWWPGEPNNSQGKDDALIICFGGIVGWSNARWNDTGPANYEIGQFPYILEQTTPPCIPHSATATAVLDHGFVVDATITDGGCGYTNTPSVVIQGGGGTGATATAVVSNGVVVNIVITDAGIGYTSTPTIFISSPFGVQIALIKAVKPAFNNLTLTTNYQLQVSGDLNTWTNQGSPFKATSTSMIYPQYWDVDNWNSLFFRLQVAP